MMPYYIFGALGPLISIVFLVFFIWLIFKTRSLSRRLYIVEEKIKQGIQTNISPSSVASVGITSKEGMVGGVNIQSAPSISSVKIASEVDIKPNKFFAWLKEDWLMKLGAFLFILGFGWFVSYAFANNWIGPIGRISLGVIGGAIIMALGFWRMIRYPSQGAVFMALGAGMTMLTIFAGRSIYGFFTPASAVAFDFVIAAFVSFASYKFNVRALAMIAQILAFVSPLLAAGQTNSIFLFSYLLLISVATLFLASVTGWRNLITSSLIFVWIYSLPFIAAGGHSGYGYSNVYNVYSLDAPIILNFAYLFSILYLLAGMFAVIKKGVESTKNEIVLAVLNGLFIFTWIHNVVSPEWRILILSAFALIFTISSFAAFKFSSQLAPFFAYGSVAVAFIAAATAAQLSGVTLTIAFTVEVFLLVVSVLFLTKSPKATSAVSWLFIVPVFLSLSSVSKYAISQELLTKDFAALLLIAVALVAAGRLLVSSFPSQINIHEKNKISAGPVLIMFGIFYFMYLIWEVVHIAMERAPDMATMTTLVIYTIFGIIAYFSGLYGGDMARKTYGTALLAFVVVRLIVVDVWDMELFGRVVTFLAIGVLLMSTAFLTKRKKHEADSLIVVK